MLRDICHEINGIVAVQHLEFNVVRYRTRSAVLTALLLLANPACAGTIAHPNLPDPLLDGGPTTPCAAGADYAAGRDVNGHPVAPADVAAPPVPVPGAIAVPRAKGGPNGRLRPGQGDSAYVSLDGKAVDKLVNPPPCR